MDTEGGAVDSATVEVVVLVAAVVGNAAPIDFREVVNEGTPVVVACPATVVALPAAVDVNNVAVVMGEVERPPEIPPETPPEMPPWLLVPLNCRSTDFGKRRAI